MASKSGIHVLVADRAALFAEALPGLLGEAPGIAKVSTATTLKTAAVALRADRAEHRDGLLFGRAGSGTIVPARQKARALA